MPYAQSEYRHRNAESALATSSLMESATKIQIIDIEQALVAARPRLIRQAQRRGVSPDAVDDVVQETLVEAWRRLNTLRTPESFHAWLDGICRNMCLRWSQTHQRTVQRQSSLQDSLQGEDTDELDIVDPLALDPTEELDRHDLATLLDRALGHLPPETRQLIELCYLAELPQREAALNLGLTINVLEARLHRARRQLRQVLSSALRADAEAFGLSLDNDFAQGWRETREWCWYCARHRLQGVFEPMVDNHLLPNPINLRMRCPACSMITHSGGYPPLDGLHSFRPALKRMMLAIRDISSGLGTGWYWCPFCRAQRALQVLLPDEYTSRYNEPSRSFIHKSTMVMECHNCEMRVDTAIEGCFWLHPVVQRFRSEHPRSFVEPEVILEYAGQRAIQICLADLTSTARLTLLVHYRTLNILTIHQS